MRLFLIFCCSFSLLASAQLREEKPLPMFAQEASSILVDSVSGWSYSKDGQWIKGDKIIYPRLISRNEEAYEAKENKLGIDNFDQLQLFPVQYGKDTLLLLVKLFTSGKYKYEVSKKGWKTSTDAYYYLFKLKDMRSAMMAVDTTVRMNKIRLMDGGLLEDIDEKKVVENIKQNVRVRERYDRVLTLMTKYVPENNSVRFHIFSLHSVFPDVEGILQDLRKSGRSLYGSKELFDYAYYETEDKIFYRFFSMPKKYSLEQTK